jgi:hypothetical protein
MQDRQPKRPRPAIDKNLLSLNDQQALQRALQRAAQLLNKSPSELLEEDPRHTNLGTSNTAEDPCLAGDITFSDSQSWQVPTMQWPPIDDWEQYIYLAETDTRGSQLGGPWAQSSGTNFEEEKSNDVASNHWTGDINYIRAIGLESREDNGDSDATKRGRPGRSPNWSQEPTPGKPWLSVPTDFLAQIDHYGRVIDVDEIGTNLESIGGGRPTNVCDLTPQHDQSISNALGARQVRETMDRVSNRPTSLPSDELPGIDVVESDWVDLKPEVSSYGSQPVEATKSGGSMVELSKPHQTFLLNKSNPESIQWVSADPSGKELQSQKPQRRGPFQNQQLRDETSNTRKLKACVRCRMQKIRCQIDSNDPGGICVTCRSVSKQKIHTLPCVRYKITECTIYRIGKAPGLEFTFRWPKMKLKDISDWADTKIRTIRVLSDVCDIPLVLSVRKFVPIPDHDSLKKSWMDGKVKKYKETTPYAIVNMNATVRDMQDYINKHVFRCMELWLRTRDDWVQETYRFARQYMLIAPPEEKSLLADFFRSWFAVRRTATTEHIVGDDNLDMEPVNDPSYELHKKVPLPPVMIQQLDMILTIGFLEPLCKKVLENFQKIVLNNKSKSWMTIYLITFMSLHSCATLTAENYRNARKHGLKRRFAIPTFIAERHHGANVFLSYYHYCTKPCDPFTIDKAWCERHKTPFPEMTPDEFDFVLRTKDMVKERSKAIDYN